MKKVLVLMGLVAAAMLVANAEAFRVTTADTGGADCELREIADPTGNRGASTEIASRVASNRNSLVYLKFGVADISAADLLGDITVRTTYRNNNLVESRYEFAGIPNTGWNYYVLNPTTAGANWDEMAINPSLAPPPGYNYDGDAYTKAVYDFFGFLDPSLTYLGQKQYDDSGVVGTNRHLPIGGAFDFTLPAGSALHQAIVAAQATDHQTLTIVMTIAHDYVSGVTPNNWTNFNYLFNPKEMLTLGSDANSSWSVHYPSNANNDYSPMLTNEPHVIPEPATMVLLGLGGLLLGRKR